MKKTKPANSTNTLPEAPLGTKILGTNYLIYFGHGRLCRLEELMDMSFGNILDKASSDVDLRTIGRCVRLGLEEHHPGLTPEAVDHVIEEAGIIAASSAIVREMNATMMGIPARRAAMTKKAA